MVALAVVVVFFAHGSIPKFHSDRWVELRVLGAKQDRDRGGRAIGMGFQPRRDPQAILWEEFWDFWQWAE